MVVCIVNRVVEALIDVLLLILNKRVGDVIMNLPGVLLLVDSVRVGDVTVALIDMTVVLTVAIEVMPNALLFVLSTSPGEAIVVLSLKGFTGQAFPLVVVVLLRWDVVEWILLTLLLSRWLNTGSLLSVLTLVLRHMLILLSLIFEQVTRLENTWLIDSGCSRHMNGDHIWFSSLTPVNTREYITFGDNGKGRVLSEGLIEIGDGFVLKRVALVQSLSINLLSVSQLLSDGFEVHFKRDDCKILDSRGDLVCMIYPKGEVFHADFSRCFGHSRYLVAGSSSEL